MKIVYWAHLDFARISIESALRDLPSVNLVVSESLDEVLAEIADTEMFVTGNCGVEAATQILDRVNRPESLLRAVHFITAGREGFDAAGHFRKGITVTGPQGAIGPTVAEHAVSLMLALNRKLLVAYQAQKLAHWDRSMARASISVEGKTALIVGAGPIGREIALRLRAFGMRTVVVTRTPKLQSWCDLMLDLPELDRRLPEAAAVFLCIALSPLTKNIMGSVQLASMDASAVLINVGRGGLVDHEALSKALTAGRLGGAGLDVTDPEPLPDRHPLWSSPNILITPHYSGVGSDLADRRIGDGAARAAQICLDTRFR